jgi:RNA ligase (TIGR02306 family)
MKLASIELVKELTTHSGADRLELAKIIGWQSVVAKGEFREGERVVFIVIDTLLPLAEWSRFLSKDGNEESIRLKTVRLRGEYSQGLVLPLSVLPEELRHLPEGTDVSEALGVRKYEKELPAGLAGVALGQFPRHVCATTDEENGLSNEELVVKVLSEDVTITRKLDGSSCTMIVRDGELVEVCSRRLSLKESPDSGFWRAARKLSVANLGKGLFVLQGELMGPGVQGNQLRLTEGEIHIFQIRREGEFLPYDEMKALCLDVLGCPAVPLLTHAEAGLTLEELQRMADAQKLPCGNHAEGIVVRPRVYRLNGEGRPLGFKIINRNYKD